MKKNKSSSPIPQREIDRGSFVTLPPDDTGSNHSSSIKHLLLRAHLDSGECAFLGELVRCRGRVTAESPSGNCCSDAECRPTNIKTVVVFIIAPLPPPFSKPLSYYGNCLPTSLI